MAVVRLLAHGQTAPGSCLGAGGPATRCGLLGLLLPPALGLLLAAHHLGVGQALEQQLHLGAVVNGVQGVLAQPGRWRGAGNELERVYVCGFDACVMQAYISIPHVLLAVGDRRNTCL